MAPSLLSPSIQRPVFQNLDKFREPAIGLVPIDDTMVDGERDIGHRANLDGIDPINFTHHHTLFGLADDDVVIKLQPVVELAAVDRGRGLHRLSGGGEETGV